MRAKSSAGVVVVGARGIVPVVRAGSGAWVGGWVVGASGRWWRVLVPTVGARPSEQPGSAQQPSCELGSTVGGAPLLSHGFCPRKSRVRPARASVASCGEGRDLLGAAGDGGVPRDAAGDDDEQLPQERGGDRCAGLAGLEGVV